MRKLVTVLCALTISFSYCQTNKQLTNNTTVGFEVDALPFVTGGYYGSVWIGHNHFRYRAIVAKVEVPDFFVKDGFTNNDIQAYAVVVDYFFKPDFKGWWTGGGFEYWDSKIQTNARLETAKYSNTIFTIGGGYVWKFYKHLYVNPWIAGHFRLAGDKEVLVDNSTFKTSLFTPEFSFKIGWHF